MESLKKVNFTEPSNLRSNLSLTFKLISNLAIKVYGVEFKSFSHAYDAEHKHYKKVQQLRAYFIGQQFIRLEDVPKTFLALAEIPDPKIYTAAAHICEKDPDTQKILRELLKQKALNLILTGE